MDIDLDQLPIPDWGLTCPRCGYALLGLPSHRCPECGLKFDMRDLVRSWTRLREPRFNGSELPLPDFGFTCPDCEYPLSGAPDCHCPRCGTRFDLQEHRPIRPWFNVATTLEEQVPMQVIEGLLLEEYVPHVLVEGQDPFGLSNRGLMISSDFYFDFLWLMRQHGRRPAAVREARQEQSWICGQCNSENPTNFDVCWSCGGQREDLSE